MKTYIHMAALLSVIAYVSSAYSDDIEENNICQGIYTCQTTDDCRKVREECEEIDKAMKHVEITIDKCTSNLEGIRDCSDTMKVETDLAVQIWKRNIDNKVKRDIINKIVVIIDKKYSSKEELILAMKLLDEYHRKVDSEIGVIEVKLKEMDKRVTNLEDWRPNIERDNTNQNRLLSEAKKQIDEERKQLAEHESRLKILEKGRSNVIGPIDINILWGMLSSAKVFGWGLGAGLKIDFGYPMQVLLEGIFGTDIGGTPGTYLFANGNIDIIYQWTFGALGIEGIIAGQNPFETHSDKTYLVAGGGLCGIINGPQEWIIRPFVRASFDAVGYSYWIYHQKDYTPTWNSGTAINIRGGISFL
jgi:hypothetical protein